MIRQLAVPCLLLLLLAAVGCASTASSDELGSNPFVEVASSSIEIVGPGYEEQDETATACADFVLDRDQFARFLRRARVITEAELHDHHDVLPCWVDAIVEDEDVTWQVRLRVGGVARAKSEGRVVVLVED